MSIRLTPVPHALPAAKPPSPQRPLLAPRAGVRGYHSVCNSTLTVVTYAIFADDADAAGPRRRRRLGGMRLAAAIDRAGVGVL